MNKSILELNKVRKIAIVVVSGFLLLIVICLGLKSIYFSPNISINQKTIVSGKPIKLRIPKINVLAQIENMGLTSLGAMESPIGPDTVGWYKDGPKPGEIGSSVIDGHSSWKNNIPAVFDNLSKLQKGDKLYIENEDGVIATFVVRDIQIYNPLADAQKIFFSSDNKAHLNLITCAGIWNDSLKSSSTRLIVFTDKE